MINSINIWIQGIVVAVIISTIIEMVLPEGNNKKYVRTILGIYILFSIIYTPINIISKKNIDLNDIFKNTENRMQNYSTKSLSVNTNDYIEKTYKNNLIEDIKNKLEEKGYYIRDCKVYIETQNEEQFGKINSIVLSIKKVVSNNSIKEININVTNDSNIEDSIQEEDINEIKIFLGSIYSLEKEVIHINE